MNQEFKPWRTIERFQGVHVVISEKLHGSNAQLVVYKDETGLHAIAGSRTRFLDAVNGPDNYGFAAFVRANEAEICEKLGEGTHYGEWVGPGINGQYGLKEKVLVLFDVRRYPPEKVLPARFSVIPVLYDGPYSEEVVAKVMEDLKTNGSRFQPGFMNPEGIVLNFPQFGAMKKFVFKPEETAWTGVKKPKGDGVKPDYHKLAAAFLQPIRLEKLLMSDENYRVGFPQNLPIIVRAYLADLVKETPEITEAELAATKKTVFGFVKSIMETV